MIRSSDNRRGGFTLLETLLTVVILVILLGVSAVGVAYHKDYLKITELDNAARDIYMAAENRAVLLQNSGASATLLSLGGAGTVELLKTDAKLDDLLPKGTIDPALWSGDFRVVYDRTTGHVREVFYAKKDIDGDLDDFRAKSRSVRVSLFRSGRTLVGYYGSDVDNSPIVTKPLPAPGVEVFIDNGEELTLKVTYTLPEGLPTGVAVTRTPSVKLYYPTDPTAPIEFDLSTLTFTGNTATYEKVLDSLAKDAGGNSQQFRDLKSGGLTGLGGKFTVIAGLTLKAVEDGYIDSAYYAEGTDNSLFAKKTGDGTTAYIANLRHLQNLCTAFSGVGTGIAGAEQAADIECGEYKDNRGTVLDPAYRFIPITNEKLSSYDGRNKQIRNLSTKTGSIAAGLFGTVSTDLAVQNTRVCWTRPEELVNGGGIVYAVGGTNAGGLIGSITGGTVKIENSFAATTVQGAAAGGLVGSAVSGCDLTIENSYADCCLSGTTAAGGLIGSGAASLSGCYAAGFIAAPSEAVETAGLTNGSASISGGVYSVARVLKADGTLEEPAKPMYQGWNESAPGSAFYLSKADEVTGAVRTALDAAFECEDATPETHVYNLRYEMSKTPGPADEALKLTPPYPFPWLADLPHYGDWAKLENKAFAPVGLAYYEEYQEDKDGTESKTYGAWGWYEDENLDSLKKDTDNPVVAKDGYALVFEGEEVPKGTYEIGGDFVKRFKHTLDTETMEWDGLFDVYGVMPGDAELEARSFPVIQDGKTYTLVPLLDPLMTRCLNGERMSLWQKPFYLKFTVKEENAPEALRRDFWFNPHFAKMVKKAVDDTQPAPPLTKADPVYIRTARHFYNMNKFPELYIEEDAGGAIKRNFYFSQELDLDYAAYTGYTEGDRNFFPKNISYENPYRQKPIGNQNIGIDGDYPNQKVCFRGTYDGNCHTIRNVVGDLNYDFYPWHLNGLFGVVLETGVLKNIVFEMNPNNILSFKSSGTILGSGVLVGINNGLIQNCAVYGVNEEITICGGWGYATGGLVGQNQKTGTIENCSAELVSLVFNQTVQDDTIRVGGIAGTNSGTIQSSYAVGKIVRTASSTVENKTSIGGLTAINSDNGKIKNCFAAVNLQGGKDKYGLAPSVSDGGTVDAASGWLTGAFKYRGEKYTVEKDTYSGVGTAMTPAQLAGKLTALAPAASTVHYDIPTTESWKGDYEGKTFPYRTGVRDRAGAVHYGLWPVEVEYPEVSLFYYEKYTDGTYGFYRSIREEEKDPVVIDTLDDDLVVAKDGYALAVPYTDLSCFNTVPEVLVRYGSATYTVKRSGTTGLLWSDNTDYKERNENGDFTQTVEGTKYILLPLRWAVHKNSLSDSTSFYQTLTVTPKKNDGTEVEAGKRTFYFNPHFSKALSCPVEGSVEPPVKPAEPTQGANQTLDDGNTVPILVRTARHFYDISQFQTSYVAGRTYYFKQERDLDYEAYTGYSTGTSTYDVRFIKGPYAQTPVGTGAKPFAGVYDGQYHKLRSVEQRVTYSRCTAAGLENEQATGLFGFSSGTIKDVVYEPNQAVSASWFSVVIPAGQDAAHGYVNYAGSLIGWNTGTVENCTAWNVRLGNTHNTIVYSGNETTQWKVFDYVGSLIGRNDGAVRNCGVTASYLYFNLSFRLNPDRNNNEVYDAKMRSKDTLGWYIGGFVGRNYGEIDRCSAEIQESVIQESTGGGNTNTIYGINVLYAGGLAGCNEKGGTISSSCAVGILPGRQPTSQSGFVAKNAGTIQNCYSAAVVRDGRSSTVSRNERYYFCSSSFNSGSITNCFYLTYQSPSWTYRGNDFITGTNGNRTPKYVYLSGVTGKSYDDLAALTETDLPGMGKAEGTDVYPFPVSTTDKDGNYYYFGADWPIKK